jgi:hypothetical protein
MKMEERQFLENKFKKKWREFLAFESLKFERCTIRYLGKDNLILLMADGTKDYIQIRLEDKEQFKKIFEALKDDKFIKV